MATARASTAAPAELRPSKAIAWSGADAETDATEDVDGDGLVASADNCPDIHNVDQANEDGDRFGDVCDPCPIAPHAVTIDDPDSDGVSGACDPFPTTPGDKIVVFEGFVRQPVGSEVYGAWTFGSGDAQVVSSLDAISAVTWTLTGPRETVSAVGTIDQMFGNFVARPIGVTHFFNAPSAGGLMCVFGVNPSNLQIYAIANNRTTAALATAPKTAAVGIKSSFESRRDDTDYVCDSDRLTSPLMTTFNIGQPIDRVGLFTRSASATFAWVMIVRSP